MKQFKDLEFKPHTAGQGKQAVMFFDNGYGVSVVRFEAMFGGGYGSYTNNESEWELAILIGNSKGADICYTTPITDDVLGYLEETKVTEIMAEVQKLPETGE